MKLFIKILFLSLIIVSCTKKQANEMPILKIGSTIISETEFSLYLMDEAKKYNSVFLKDQKTIQLIKDTVVLNLIIEELLLHWAKENGAYLSDQAVDDKIKEQIQSYPDEQAFRRIYSELKIQKNLLKKRTRVLSAKETLMEKMASETSPDEKQIKDYYQKHLQEFKEDSKVQLQQIVVHTELEAQNIHKALKNGSSFDKLASDYSLGAESDNQGKLGWVEKGTLPVFDAAFNLPIGQISSPQKSPYGYHIFQVLERKKGRQLPLDEVKGQISKLLQAEQAQEKYKNWLEKQIHLVKVEKNEEALRNIQIHVKSDS